jgi:menaquinone-9 beta-reductase
MPDVLIAGAGPAGCLAAIVLARAGVRVLLVDRARFPRDKLCGDTVNPGALAVLARHGVPAADAGLPVNGMLVTGPAGARVEGRYPAHLTGRALTRRAFDYAMLQSAARAGASIEEGALVEAPLLGSRTGAAVAGVRLQGAGSPRDVAARLVIAADGRASRLARALSLARFPRRPRRWAVGAYFEGVAGLGPRGEMHLRAGHYVGVAPLPGGLANVCVVTADRQRLRRADEVLRGTLRADGALAARFARARMVTPPVTLGPLAVDASAAGVPGLVLAGDAAGLIDPMTGDGLRFALRGAELAAIEVLRSLEAGDGNAFTRLEAARRREFGGKWRFNRALRGLAGSADALRVAGLAARVASWPVARIIRYAGDVPAA